MILDPASIATAWRLAFRPLVVGTVVLLWL